MKNYIIYLTFLALMFSSACQQQDAGYNCVSGSCTATQSNPQYLTLADCQSVCSGGGGGAGYNCVSGNCVSVTSNAQYSTLSACQSSCNSSITGYNCNSGYCGSTTGTAQYSTYSACQSACGNGSVNISASWNSTYVNCTPAYSVTIGLGYSSTDIANEAYFYTSGVGLNSPLTMTKSLSPGTYYYKGKKTYNSSSCGTGQGVPATVVKSGSFTITSGQTSYVSFQLI